VTFFDFNFLLLFWRHPTAFQLAPEAVDESRPNGFLSTRGIPPHLPVSNLRRSVPGHRYVKDFSCWDQFLCLAFAQLTYRESLRDIEACLRAQQPKLYHMASGAKFLGTRWHTPTNTATGGSTPISPKS